MADVILLALVLTVALLALAAILAARYGIWKEVSVSGARGVIQILILSSRDHPDVQSAVMRSALVILVMAAVAGHDVYPLGRLDRMFQASAASIAVTSLALLLPFFLLGIFPLEPGMIPTGSILIGNAMNVSSLAIDRYRGGCRTVGRKLNPILRWATTRRHRSTA
jgi:putative ABC transport system permease protein